MLIRIVCPEHCAYEGEAAFAVVPSTDGECGILPKHANEICTITDGYVRVCDKEMGTVDHTFAVGGGYAQSSPHGQTCPRLHARHPSVHGSRDAWA